MTLLALLALSPAPALGQPVFFDDFEGNALLPHWNGQPTPSYWQYDVSNSMLNVTNLYFPSNPKSPANFVTLGAYGAYAPQSDFELEARMGWGGSEGVVRFELTVMINQGGVATIGYREHDLGVPAGIYAATGAGMVTIPSPPPGLYDFKIRRTGTQVDFYFEGTHFATLNDPYGGPVDGLQFFFASPYPGQSGPFHVDRVQMVPAPSSILFLPAIVLASIRRRRR